MSEFKPPKILYYYDRYNDCIKSLKYERKLVDDYMYKDMDVSYTIADFEIFIKDAMPNEGDNLLGNDFYFSKKATCNKFIERCLSFEIEDINNQIIALNHLAQKYSEQLERRLGKELND